VKSKFLAVRFTFSVAVIGFVLSCASSGLPTHKERTSIQSGKQTIVLLRVTCEWKDGTPVEPFPPAWSVSKGANRISIGLGSYLVGGKVEWIKQRFLSPETRKQGWTYLLLKPGTHHLSFFGISTNTEIRNSPRFKVNIPINNQLVYAGTLNIYCHYDRRRGEMLLGLKYCEVRVKDRIDVLNEKNLVDEITKNYLSDFESPITMLMQRVY